MRRIYRKSVAPHNLRVGVDGGIPSDNVQAAILLMQDTQKYIDAGLVRLLVSPELFGTKQRVSAPYIFATKGYSANSPQRELGDELITQPLNITVGWSVIDANTTITDADTYTVGAGGTGGIRSALTLVAGKSYRLRIIGNVTAGNFSVFQGTTSATRINLTGVLSGSFTKDIVFTASATTELVLYLRNDTPTSVTNLTQLLTQEFIPADLTQTTANSQPYLDKIAPAEPWGLKNTNGDARFMSHSAVSFGATDKWTREFAINWNGSNNAIVSLFGKPSDTLTSLSIKKTTNVFSFTNESGTAVDGTVSTLPLIGKAKIIHTIADGGGTLKIYANGVLFDTITNPTNVTFTQDFAGQATAARNFYGKIFHDMILADTLDFAFRAVLLRSIFPEIPTTKVTGLDCAVRALDVVCTPAGTVIANVTVDATWAGLTTAAWCHQSNDLALGSVYGKQYNGYARDTLVTDLASSGFGYHVATEAEFGAITALGLALKARLTSYWTTANGTNNSGLTLLGGASRNADGTFATAKGSVKYWCADSDKTFTLLDDGTMSIDAADKKIGAYILLIKDYTGEFLYDSEGSLIIDSLGSPIIVTG